MLKKRITKLMDRYERCDEHLSAIDVMEELEEILDEEEYDNDLSPKLLQAIDKYVLQRHYAERGGGRIPDGGDEFIKEIEEIIGYEN